MTSTIYCVSPNTCGTYLGLIEKIPYLKSLGITAVELMPVHQFDPEEGNYWGYMPLNFFSPHDAYASVAGNEIVEFKTMVKGLHEAGIEVIIDVVYNHTTEADANGPNYAFPGIDNSTYYLWAEDRSEYRNDAGLFRCAHDCRGLGPGKLSTRQNVSGDDTAAMETDSATTCGPSSEEILDWWKLS